jgi:ADP-ribosylglycohydrolase
MLYEYPPLPMLAALVRDEITQRAEEGCPTEGFPERWEAVRDDRAGLTALYENLCVLNAAPDFPFVEPNDLPGIRALRPDGPRDLHWNPADAELLDRMQGAWLGRCCGCALGKPFETGPFFADYRNVRVYLEAADAYPLDNYAPQNVAAGEKVGLKNGLGCPLSHRDRIAYMESDDDIRYTILGLNVLERRGADFTTRDVGAWWLENFGTGKVYMAAQAVYRNFVLLGATHAWELKNLSEEQMDWARRYLNPYREMINARIRSDGWAYGAAGHPERAAEFSFRDASLTHVKNGLYGGMFIAALIAAAFVLDDPLSIVETALTEVPARSRLYADVQETIAICRRHGFRADRFEGVLADIWARFGRYHPIHMPNNNAATVAALLLGGHDFEKVITIAVMAGWDTDCNGATAGSVCGAMLGAGRLPEKWTAPLHDTLLSEVPGFHPIAISECARRSADVWRALRGTR